MREFEPTDEEPYFQNNLETGNCIISASTEPNTTGLFNPHAFTPVELRRIAKQQVLRGREVHILFQKDTGVEELTVDLRNADLSGRKPEIYAREIGELIELADGFFIVTPNQ